ncbi:hypothetical protein SB775_26395 [Peribacillus sp. SIMBA_075]|uniref:hypothetical protein n=1 Tax=Peribacillus sp. SIMBA_075 TaxID=3085813 RepID=UPI00397C5B9C
MFYEETEFTSNKQELSEHLDEKLKNKKESLENSSDLLACESSWLKVKIIFINGP